MTPDAFLEGEPRPTVNQTAWVFAHLFDHMAEPGSFGYLIYNRMGFPNGSRCVLQPAGGQAISNAFWDAESYIEMVMRKKLRGRRQVRRKHFMKDSELYAVHPVTGKLTPSTVRKTSRRI